MQELRGIRCPEKGFNLESEFTTRWLWKLEELGFWSKKWSDASRDLKPYDCDIRTHKSSYHCEIKVIENTLITEYDFRPNQRKALKSIYELWWNWIAVIYSKKENAYLVKLYTNLF